MKIAVVSITRHGIAMAGRIAALLPEATLFAPEKFAAEAQAAVLRAAAAGAFGAALTPLFSRQALAQSAPSAPTPSPNSGSTKLDAVVNGFGYSKL